MCINDDYDYDVVVVESGIVVVVESGILLFC